MNSFCNPIGFIAPFTIQGKIRLRQLTSKNINWDIPLPREKRVPESTRITSNAELLHLCILNKCHRREIHVFFEASIETIL